MDKYCSLDRFLHESIHYTQSCVPTPVLYSANKQETTIRFFRIYSQPDNTNHIPPAVCINLILVIFIFQIKYSATQPSPYIMNDPKISTEIHLQIYSHTTEIHENLHFLPKTGPEICDSIATLDHRQPKPKILEIIIFNYLKCTYFRVANGFRARVAALTSVKLQLTLASSCCRLSIGTPTEGGYYYRRLR